MGLTSRPSTCATKEPVAITRISAYLDYITETIEANTPSSEARILNGTKVGAKTHPYLVSFYNKLGKLICALISDSILFLLVYR